MAGGGTQNGLVCGATDEFGYNIIERPMQFAIGVTRARRGFSFGSDSR
jgi:hypothetical protein